TLQTKTPGQTGQNPNQKNLTKQPEKSGIKKTSTPKREKEVNKNNKQKPPNTLLSSQTTHPTDRARRPRRKAAISRAGR
ncbi:hypothetical protein, partial [uncultured Mycolicibacterium sp.]|uniref:hypothetical protein n=1 Tax=uncultured Mycolicibacterium sp. TaxID=2320817 RepID=UPI0032B16EBA